MADFLSSLLGKSKEEQYADAMANASPYPNAPMDPDQGVQDYNVNTLLANAPPIEVPKKKEIDPDLQAKRDLYNQYVMDTQMKARAGLGPLAGLGSHKFAFGPNGEEPETGLDPDTWDKAEKQYKEKKETEDRHRAEAEAEANRLKEKLQKARAAAGLAKDETPPQGMAESLPARSGDDMEEEEKIPQQSSTPLETLSDDEEESQAPSDTKEKPKEEVKDYLKALIEAQQKSGQLAGMQMMMKGAERIGAGLAHRDPDKNYMNEMTPLINQPIENILNQQKVSMLGLEQESKRRDLELKKDMDNPNSKVSDIARQILKRGAPDLKADNLTATQMTQLIPGLKTVLETEYNRETKKALAAEKHQDNLDKQAKRDTEKQNNAYSEMSVKALGTRAPANVQLALKNKLFIDNAKGLLSKYPNLNDMPQNDVELFRTELARIAGGGVATGHGMKTLDYNTFNSQWKQFLGKVGNKPTGADLGKFIKNNASYLEELDKGQSRVLNDFHKGIFNSYKDKLRPDQKERFMAEHPDAFAEAPGAPQGMVKIKRKADGLVKTLSAQDATEFLKDPQFELVK